MPTICHGARELITVQWDPLPSSGDEIAIEGVNYRVDRIEWTIPRAANNAVASFVIVRLANPRVTERDALRMGSALAAEEVERAGEPPGHRVAALLAAVERITREAPNNEPNGPAEAAIVALEMSLAPSAWAPHMHAKIARINGHMAALCGALADDARDLRVAAEAVRAHLGGAPSPLDAVVAEVLALSPADDSIFAPSDMSDAYSEIRRLCEDDPDEGDGELGERAVARRDLKSIARVALAGLEACDAASGAKGGA